MASLGSLESIEDIRHAVDILNFIAQPPTGKRSIVMSVSVCLSVCVCLSTIDHIFGTTRPIFTKIVLLVTYVRDSALAA